MSWQEPIPSLVSRTLNKGNTVDDDQYEAMAERGMFSFGSLGDYRNAIVLCASCHKHFDQISKPGWIFLPTDLDWFINWERKDYKRRRMAFSETGRRLSRIFPAAGDYEEHMQSSGGLKDTDGGLHRGGLFDRYILRPIFSPDAMEALKDKGLRIPGKHPRGPKRWHGCPMAAINRGFVVTGAPWLGLPEKEWDQLCELQKLYSRGLSANVDETQMSVNTDTSVLVDAMPHVGTSNPTENRQHANAASKPRTLLTAAQPIHDTSHQYCKEITVPSDNDPDSAVDLRSEVGQRRLRKRILEHHGMVSISDADDSTESRSASRAKRRRENQSSDSSNEWVEPGIHPDTWCFGPFSSSNAKARMFTG